AQWERYQQLDLMFIRMNLLNCQSDMPVSTQCSTFRIDHLSGSSRSLRHDAFGLRIPPFVIPRWLGEDCPYFLERSGACCRRTKIQAHAVYRGYPFFSTTILANSRWRATQLRVQSPM